MHGMRTFCAMITVSDDEHVDALVPHDGAPVSIRQIAVQSFPSLA